MLRAKVPLIISRGYRVLEKRETTLHLGWPFAQPLGRAMTPSNIYATIKHLRFVVQMPRITAIFLRPRRGSERQDGPLKTRTCEKHTRLTTAVK